MNFKVKVILLAIFVFAGCNNFFVENEVVDNIDDYELVFGESGSHPIDLFPKSIDEKAEISEFYYRYYNSFDPNYLSYMIVSYDDKAYDDEKVRLSNLTSSDKYLIYGATSFNYPIISIVADQFGYKYVLDNAEDNELIYVELNFCNYFSDIDYEEIIKSEHLPCDFDATPGNQTRISWEENDSEFN